MLKAQYSMKEFSLEQTIRHKILLFSDRVFIKTVEISVSTLPFENDNGSGSGNGSSRVAVVYFRLPFHSCEHSK